MPLSRAQKVVLLHTWCYPVLQVTSVPWHQGADITSGQPARTELDSGGAAAAATPSLGGRTTGW